MKPITILYGTETGNSEYCAKEVAEVLKGQGLKSRIFDMDDYTHADLPDEHLLIVVTSTYGNGDPPANAYDLIEHLNVDKPDLSGMRFAVCGLGDSCFQLFSQCGKDFDRLLEELGGVRVVKRVDCDADYEVPFSQFRQSLEQYVQANTELFPPHVESEESTKTTAKRGGLFSKVKGWLGGNKEAGTIVTPTAQTQIKKLGTRERPIHVNLMHNRLLSVEGSNKETRHYVIDLKDTPFEFRAGDCFGVYPQNCPTEVSALLDVLQVKGDVAVHWDDQSRTLEDVLLNSACIHNVSVKLVELLASQQGPAQTAFEGGAQTLTQYIAERHVFDVLQEHQPHQVDLAQFVATLKPLQPRLYSVANSPLVHPNEVHFTVETLRYAWNGRTAKGVASCWLAEQAAEGSIPIYLQSNTQFRLPEPKTPIIMIGAGTGIAPFRAFLQERSMTKASGKNWLFFGHQHEAKDFLYRDELTAFLEDETLNTLTCAWSRDTAEKVYVQHRLAEHGAQVWQWLEEGAVVYVCGDATGMAPGVHEALVQIAEANGSLDGAAFMKGLESSNRYILDVY
jgi:sulfite reductase (NADPH) flavoprotein alpha-component